MVQRNFAHEQKTPRTVSIKRTGRRRPPTGNKQRCLGRSSSVVFQNAKKENLSLEVLPKEVNRQKERLNFISGDISEIVSLTLVLRSGNYSSRSFRPYQTGFARNVDIERWSCEDADGIDHQFAKVYKNTKIHKRLDVIIKTAM